MSLYMLQLQPDPAALIKFLASQGLNRREDSDLGYGIHAWFAATFGKLAPSPFRLHLDPRNRKPPKLLAYSRHSKDALLDQAQSFAEPLVQAVCSLEQDFAVAAMPNPERWQPGRRLGFEILICPVARQARTGAERDLFLHHADRAAPDANLSRAQVYSDWLATQCEKSAHIKRIDLENFHLVPQLRRGRKAGENTRENKRFIRPAALLTGVLEITDGTAFHDLLATGIGRHKAFGYGMLLLRPA